MPGQGHLIGGVVGAYGLNAGGMIGDTPVTSRWAVQNVYSTYTPKGVGVPHVLRNDPEDVKIWSEAAGLTYGVTNNFALSLASQYFEKQQDVNVFKGMSGTTLEGVSQTHSSGIGDTFLTGLYHIYGDPINSINASFGMSLPTGSTTIDAVSFSNSGVPTDKRGVYTLQLGSGTFDAMPGITYLAVLNQWTWGLSYRARLPLDTNNQGYRYGDYNEFDAWTGYKLLPGIGTTLRILGSLQGHIHGYDPQILGYGPCSNPLWYGNDHIDLLPGVDVSGRFIGLPRLTFYTEGDVPLYQNFSGLHTAKCYAVAMGLKYKFF
ncbi:MAG: hypothetical protein ACP5IL_08465 [Syntrophobacteraceae bacterium]